MSNLSELLPSGGGQNVVSLTASGTIPGGATVVLNSDGTVSVITAGTSNGTTEIESGEVYQGLGAVYDPVNDKILIFYNDVTDSNTSKAVVGTVSGTSITLGTPVTFNSGNAAAYMAGSYDTSSGKILIIYGKTAGTTRITASVATISGTAVSFGSATSHGSSFNTGHSGVSISYDTNRQKHFVFFCDGANSNFPTAVPVTISGTSASFGTSVVAESNACDHMVTCYNPSTYYHMTVRSVGSSSGTIQMFDINGSGSITAGSTTSLTSNHIDEIGISYDTASGYHVIVYEDVNQNEYLYARLATASGSTPSLVGS